MLDAYIEDYNAMYKTKFSTKDSQSFYNYYKDIAKRIKERERKGFNEKDRVDILLVVNMFLTGFDAKKLNTLYVDKNLKYHGLIQACSRTNRILGEKKSHGNIVCFRNLKKNTDEAIALFSNKEAEDEIFVEPYDTHVEKFNNRLEELRDIVPTVESVNELPSEVEELAFVKTFRALIRTKNVLGGFSEFTFDDLGIDEQEFEDYKSKYLDIHDKYKKGDEGEGESIIDDIDFELELIQRDEINVAYILELLATLHEQMGDPGLDLDGAQKDAHDKQKKVILDLLGNKMKLRSKRELIERFINDYMPQIGNSKDIKKAFSEYWDGEKETALKQLCEEEGLEQNKLQKIVEAYLFSGKPPLREDIVDTLREGSPSILKRKTITERITEKILSFVHIFDDDMGV